MYLVVIVDFFVIIYFCHFFLMYLEICDFFSFFHLVFRNFEGTFYKLLFYYNFLGQRCHTLKMIPQNTTHNSNHIVT